MARRSKKTKVPVQQRPVPISVASYLTGVETHTIRYWEREFSEFLQPVRTAGGQRRKRLLKDEMYTIAGAKRKLQERFGTPQKAETNNGHHDTPKRARAAKR